MVFLDPKFWPDFDPRLKNSDKTWPENLCWPDSSLEWFFLQNFYRIEQQAYTNVDCYIRNDFIKNNLNHRNLNFNEVFEIFSVVIIFYLKKLKDKDNAKSKNLSQTIIDNFVRDLDQHFREQGIGDMSIGKYVKTYVKRFYFRVSELENFFSKREGFDNNKFNEYLIKYNIIFNNSEINYTDNLINDLQSLIKRSQNLKINQNLYKDLFN